MSQHVRDDTVLIRLIQFTVFVHWGTSLLTLVNAAGALHFT